MRHSYHTEQWLPLPIDRVFAFFADPANLPRLMRPWQMARIDNARIVPPPEAPADARIASTGSHLTLSFRPIKRLPFRMKWHAAISEFVWNGHFCDRQIKGPFAYWSHCHYVSRASRNGIDGTLVADDLEYEVPFGFAGHLAHRFLIRRQIESTFAVRQQRLLQILPPTANSHPPHESSS
jgi:ligand-binding SRPBCC domain-containing protein